MSTTYLQKAGRSALRNIQCVLEGCMYWPGAGQTRFLSRERHLGQFYRSSCLIRKLVKVCRLGSVVGFFESDGNPPHSVVLHNLHNFDPRLNPSAWFYNEESTYSPSLPTPQVTIAPRQHTFPQNSGLLLLITHAMETKVWMHFQWGGGRRKRRYWGCKKIKTGFTEKLRGCTGSRFLLACSMKGRNPGEHKWGGSS